MKIVRHVQGLDFLLYTTATFLSWSHSLLYIKKILKIYSKTLVNVMTRKSEKLLNTKIAVIEANITIILDPQKMFFCPK